MSLRTTAESIFGQNSNNAALLAECEPLRFDYSQVKNPTQRKKVENATIQVRTYYKQTVSNIIKMGKHLREAKEILDYGLFGKWLSQEFPDFHHDTANNFMNASRLAEEHGEQKVINSGLSPKSLYILSRSTVPVEAQEKALELGSTVDEKKARELVRQYRALRLSQQPITNEAKAILQNNPIAENPRELERIANLSKPKQIAVARILTEQKELSVRKAVEQLKPERSRKEQIASPVTASVVKELKGNWLNNLKLIAADSVDVLFVEAPLSNKWILDYGDLCDEAWRILKPGGVVLTTVGQQNLVYLARHIGDLQVGWTFSVRRRAGNSNRLIGLNVYCSWVPLVCLYKSPWKASSCVDDVRSIEEDESTTSLETAFTYYIEKFMPSAGTLIHCIPEQSQHFNLSQLNIDKAALIYKVH